MSDYNPLTALKIVRDALKTASAPAESKGLLNEHGEPVYTVTKKPDVLCVLLRAFTDAEGELPPDFADVEKSAHGIKTHERPDGGAFLGAFDSKDDTLGVVLVYGDPLMPVEKAAQYAQSFRKKMLWKPDIQIVQ